MKTNSLTILVVEEEPVMRESLALVLQDEGYRCLPAASAGEALSLLDREDVDLVLLDLATGSTRPGPLFRLLRERQPNLPVLLISHYNDREALVPLLHQGACGYLFKPLDFEELIDVLPSCLNS